jgi:hypothetical protein
VFGRGPCPPRAGAGEAVILERLGIARLLAQQHLQHRQQLRRIGMFQIDDAHIRPARRALVELGRDRRQPRQGRCVTAQRDRIGAVDRHHRHAFGRQPAQRLGELARADIVHADHPGGRAVHRHVDLAQNLANPPHIVGEVGHDDRIAAGR